MKPKSLRAKKQQFSLYGGEVKIIDRLSKKRRLYNRSAALRQIIQEWHVYDSRATVEENSK